MRSSSLLATVLLFLLTSFTLADGQDGTAAKTYLADLGDFKVTVNLPEDYSVAQIQGIVAILCPWNEYFTPNVMGFPIHGQAPPTTQEEADAEVDYFVQSNSGVKLINRKVWMEPDGLRATFQNYFDTSGRKRVSNVVIFSRDKKMFVLTLMGDETSLEDQIAFQGWFLEALKSSTPANTPLGNVDGDPKL